MDVGTKRKGDQSFPLRERSRRLRVCKGSKAPVIRAKDELGFPDGQDRCYVSTISSPNI